eukprot:TRINITY_DN53718_c0_g1_i1.p1 TRINITY_DN53718_c0_g1~~TRINITY_DN53718_c0_g1_i1.p1  ORF type:complete len:573 (-),score=76.78 TRINITY_DN53718_c0_g1_i1:124-1608(-)
MRTLNVKYEKEKHTSAKLQQRVNTLEKKLAEYEGSNVLTLPSTAGGSEAAPSTIVMPGSEEDYAKQIKEWKEAADKAHKTIGEMRRQNQQLKDDIKRVKSTLQKEIGDDVSVDKAIDEGGGWRGRAQQITLLKQKLKELQKQQNNTYDGLASEDGTMSRAAPSHAPSHTTHHTYATTCATGRDVDDVQKDNLDRISNDRQTKINQLTLQLTEATTKIKEYNQTVEATKARTVILEKTNNDLKTKLHRVIEKTENDDKLIEMYKSEMSRLRQAQSSGVPKPSPEERAAIAEKDRQIDNLKAELALSQRKLLDSMYGSFTKEKEDLSGLEDNKQAALRLKLAHVEIDKLRDLVSLLREQMDTMATAQGGTHEAQDMHKVSVDNVTHVQPKEDKNGMKSKINMLKEENTSLKTQLATLVRAKESEILHYQTLLEKQKATFEAEVARAQSSHSSRSSTPPANFSADTATLQAELQSMKQQYNDLKKQYNTMQMKAMKK